MLWANDCRRPSPGRDRAEMSRSEPRSRRDLGPLSTWSRYGEIWGDLGRSGEIALSTWSGMTLETSPPWIIVTETTACSAEATLRETIDCSATTTCDVSGGFVGGSWGVGGGR